MSHPYTIGMFDSLPDLNPSSKRLKLIPGLMPDPTDLPKGCKFAPRCAHSHPGVHGSPSSAERAEPGHYCRCLYPQHKEERV
ncbi:MAG: oligopeptide/dipeptide ABC transporter ATP-binding protein [Lawsonibacter sp.]